MTKMSFQPRFSLQYKAGLVSEKRKKPAAGAAPTAHLCVKWVQRGWQKVSFLVQEHICKVRGIERKSATLEEKQ